MNAVFTCFAWGIFLLLGQSAQAQSNNNVITDYGDPQSTHLWQALHNIESGQRQEPLHLLQLGDSHTAGDYFSGHLRDLLQARFGNAGIGWITPGFISNQRSDLVSFHNKGIWQLADSKRITHRGPFPLGGLYNAANGNAIVEITLKNPGDLGPWQISLWQQALNTPWSLALRNGKFYKLRPEEFLDNSPWQLSTIKLESLEDPSLFLLAPPGGKLGGIILDRLSPGVTLDALGINGATAATINRWSQSSLVQQLKWRDPGLIILAYGTNEAFDNDWNQENYEAELRQAIQNLRRLAPQAALLLIGAPGAGKSKPPYVKGICSQALPPNLINVQKSQLRIAQQEKTLYWDWAGVMGGNCGVTTWLARKPALMRPDRIHFTAEGYALSAEVLYKSLMQSLADSPPAPNWQEMNTQTSLPWSASQ